MVNDRIELLKAIQVRRRTVEHKKDVVEGWKKEVEETPEFKDLTQVKDHLSLLEYDLASLEAEYRKVCLESFKETGEKNQPGGVVGVYKVFDYDTAQARNWAIEHKHVGLLTLNNSEFKKVAKSLEIDFVKISEVPRMKLSKDLSKWLEGETDA